VAECSASAMDTLPDQAPQGTMQSERLRRTVHYAEYNSAPHVAGRVHGTQRLAPCVDDSAPQAISLRGACAGSSVPARRARPRRCGAT